MANKKINWLLILQGWAMLWVVIGHSFLGEPGCGPEWENVLYRFAYSFHMPLFMLVSGWLFYRTRMMGNEKGRWTYPQIIQDKALRLLLPGFVFSVVAFVLKAAFPGEMVRETELNLHSIAHAYLYPNDNPLRELWFIATLFWYFLLTPLWKLVIKHEWSRWGMIVALVLFYYYHPICEFLCLDRVFRYGLWFYLGLVISKNNIENFVKGWSVFFIFFVGIFVYGLGLFTSPLITTAGGIIISFALAVFLDGVRPKTFASFRNNTYQIFLMGIFFQILVKIIFRHYSLPYVPTFVLCAIVGLYAPVLLSKVIEKINWKPILLCVGLKKQ